MLRSIPANLLNVAAWPAALRAICAAPRGGATARVASWLVRPAASERWATICPPWAAPAAWRMMPP